MHRPIAAPVALLAALSATAATASDLWTASDPFVGKWKLNAARSVIVDQMVVEATSAKRFTFRFEGGPAETIVADGADQAGLPGTTLAVKAGADGALHVVRKQAGRVVISATWRLSDHDRVLHDAFTAVQADGSGVTTDYVYRRMGGTSGFAGTWESTTPQTGLQYELRITPAGGRGLSFAIAGTTKTIVFDGREHAVSGAIGALSASGRRRGDRVLDYAEATGGKALDSRTLALSQGGKTLTMTIHRAGRARPDVLVFARD